MTVQEFNKLSQYPKDAEITCKTSINVNLPYNIHSNIKITQEDIEEWEPTMDDFGTCDIMDIY